ncbi:MAG: DUF5320 domain-containing protein [Clostridiaceae bacterium]|jgi:hypothetical protein|nr:DUF5320 domain-containing protein [Clostridiaceae bacterium]
MPRGDGTGPMGMGQMTGRGAGFCAGFAAPGYANRVGFGCGFGGGRGFRRMFYANTRAYEPDTSEKELLSRQAEFLENQLQQVKKRLSNFKEDAE